MKCPYCGFQESKVVDSRPADDGSIRRRRECLQCERRFTTYETVESLPMVVIKKDGSRQSFDRSKILRGIQRSCEKRPVPVADMERMASEIEQELQNSLERETSTEVIGGFQLFHDLFTYQRTVKFTRHGLIKLTLDIVCNLFHLRQ